MLITIRRAEQSERDALAELACHSKGYWGYDETFLEACRAELTVSPRDVERIRVTVGEEAGEIVGFYALGGEPPEGELCLFFVEPERIGTGVGRALWGHCLVTASYVGLSLIRIESDPFAEGFYLAMRAIRVGETPSQSIRGRSLPLLSFDVDKVPIEMRPVQGLTNTVEPLVEGLRSELAALVPGAEVQHIGATSLPDGFTKGDVDVNLRVSSQRFAHVVATLSLGFEIAQPQNWTATYASFSDLSRALPVGIQVTVEGSDDDFLIPLRDRLLEDARLRHQYDQIKRDAAPAGRDAYWQAKHDFLRRLLR